MPQMGSVYLPQGSHWTGSGCKFGCGRVPLGKQELNSWLSSVVQGLRGSLQREVYECGSEGAEGPGARSQTGYEFALVALECQVSCLSLHFRIWKMGELIE